MGKTSDLDTGGYTQPIPVGTSAGIEYGVYEDVDPWITIEYTAENVILSFSANKAYAILASSSPGSYSIIDTNNYTGEVTTGGGDLNFTYTHDGKTVYYSTHSHTAFAKVTGIGNAVMPYMNSYAEAVAWTMVYGDSPAQTTQHIPVKWNSGYRSEPYQTSFKITVNYNE